ncbi:MAG: LEA type 2 family protein [Bacteroidetes bacterium]|nr:LEA type 2 family protein [Bacteroidota bacterium]
MKNWWIFPCFFLFFACSKPQAVEYRDLKNVRIDSAGFTTSVVKMDLVYFNPNNFSVDLKNINCDVYINQNYVGHYMLDTNMHIAKRSEFYIPSRMSVDMKNLLKNTLVSLFSQDFLLDVKGTVKLGKSGFNLTVPFQYSGRQSISIFK